MRAFSQFYPCGYTCDSDGKINKFIDLRDIKDTLMLHQLKENEPYYLGIFLMGAYQDIMGDLHNLSAASMRSMFSWMRLSRRLLHRGSHSRKQYRKRVVLDSVQLSEPRATNEGVD